MFGSLTSLKPGSGNDLGERMLNNVASQSIRHLFTSSESVDVSIRCNPSSKLLQGSIDSFKMYGRSLVIRRDFLVEEMSFETDAVSIDPGSLLSGKLRLKQPTQAVAKVTLSEAGINKAFTSELVRQHMVNLTLDVLTNLSGGEPVSFRDVRLTLLSDNQVKIEAKTDLPNRQDVPISLRCTVAVEKRRRIGFNDPTFDPEGIPDDVQGLSQIVTMAFATVLNGMVDLDRFDLDGVLLRINRLETQDKMLVFTGYAQVERFPGT